MFLNIHKWISRKKVMSDIHWNSTKVIKELDKFLISGSKSSKLGGERSPSLLFQMSHSNKVRKDLDTFFINESKLSKLSGERRLSLLLQMSRQTHHVQNFC